MRGSPDVARRRADRRPAHGLTFLPFLGGERSLGWDAHRRGLSPASRSRPRAGEIAQAALEGVAYRLADVLDAIGGLESVVATGHALLANDTWLQILADVLGRTVEVSGAPEGSARGAALVAFERLGRRRTAGLDGARQSSRGPAATRSIWRLGKNNGS